MQYYTLDEAAKKMGIGVDEFRKKLATEWKTVRRFPDGATLRFQARDIDELARRTGRSSDPDLQLGDAPLSLAEEPAPAIAKKKADETIFVPPESSEEFVPLAIDDPSAPTKTGKSGSDSDVKLEKTAGGKIKPVPGKDEPTEVIEAPKTPRPFALKDEGKKKTRVTSEFELSLSPDEDDFNLDLTDDSDEVPIGRTSRKDRKGPDSGINLADPADSGISLEKDSSEFELQLEPDAPAPKSASKVAPKTPKPAVMKDDSDSEFELSLDEPSDPSASPLEAADQKDIFETDFELPAIDDSGSEDKSSSEEMAESNFDIDIDEDASGEESASEVVAIEEEQEGVDELEPIVDEDDEPKLVREVAAGPTQWGPLPVIALAPCALIMFFVGLMGLELVGSMWGFNSPARGAGPIVKAVASMFGEVKE